jgi:signal transduction histidine kinase
MFEYATESNTRAKKGDRAKARGSLGIILAPHSPLFRTAFDRLETWPRVLWPLEDALSNSRGILPIRAAASLTVSHRNALRLLKLVNTMLDFSRIEAGRAQACYQPVDLAPLTAEQKRAEGEA